MSLTSDPPISNSTDLAFADALRDRLDRVLANQPDDVQALRRSRLEKFLAQGIPTAKDEEWKYTSLRALSEMRFSGSSEKSPDLFSFRQKFGLGDSPMLVFSQGRFCPDLSDAKLPPGIRFASLASVATPNLLGQIAALSGKLGSTNDERFVDLNAALHEDGAILDVDEGAQILEPIQVVFLAGGEQTGLCFPRLLVRASAGSSVRIHEYHAGEGDYFTAPVAEIDLGSGAVVEHVRIQDESSDAIHVANLSIRQSAGSNYTNTNVQFGARLGRIDANVWVGGEHAETWLNGVYVGTGRQHLDNHTRIDHAVPNCHSFEVYKGILDDHAAGVFNGKIFVYPDAQKTDAKQTNQALLLSPNATVDTKPQLEIFADDVQCTHGATVGQLREDALFYLRSRGIPEKQARNLLVYAFAAEGLDRISTAGLRETLEARLFEKLHVDQAGSEPESAP